MKLILVILMLMIYIDSSFQFFECNAYYSEKNVLISHQICFQSGARCCGTCTSRYCCTNLIKFLNQNKCSNTFGVSTRFPSDMTHFNDDDDLTVPIYFIIVAICVTVLCIIGCIIRMIRQYKSPYRVVIGRRRRNLNIIRDTRANSVYTIESSSTQASANMAPPPYSVAIAEIQSESPPPYQELQIDENHPKY